MVYSVPDFNSLSPPTILSLSPISSLSPSLEYVQACLSMENVLACFAPKDISDIQETT